MGGLTVPDPQRPVEPTDPREAEVTPEDRALAPTFWSHYATPLLKRLLGARKAEQ